MSAQGPPLTKSLGPGWNLAKEKGITSTIGQPTPDHPATEPLARGGRTDQVLSGLTIATLPLGSLAYASESRNLLISYSLLIGVLLLSHLLAGSLTRRCQNGPIGVAIRLSLVLLLTMFVPVLAGDSQARAIAAYVSFAGGTLCGLTIAAVWTTTRRRIGFIDVSLMLFVIVTSVQIHVFRNLDPGTSLHQAKVAWGASNYVAGTLIVASLAVIARLVEIRASRWLWLVPAGGFVSAMLTLSRGAVVAGSIGVLVLMWNSGRTATRRTVLRLCCVALVVAAAELFTAITEVRSVGGYDPGQNIAARVELIELSWDQFVSSPLTGTGWLALRDVAGFDVPISFAHNVVLSFLQIGGLFGLAFLILLAHQSMKGMRNGTPMFAAVVAALAMSFSDPFFEGGVGALVSWAVIGYAAFSTPSSSEQVREPVSDPFLPGLLASGTAMRAPGSLVRGRPRQPDRILRASTRIAVRRPQDAL